MVSCAVLIAIGVNPDGHRVLLGVSVSLSEAECTEESFWAVCRTAGCMASG